MFKLILLFCVVISIAHSVIAAVEKRGHHDPWSPRDCWDHGTNFVINPFCATLTGCGRPPSIAHGKYSDPAATLQGVTVFYTCDPGYSMTGSSKVTCVQTVDMPNAVWSQTPTCLKMCPTPPTIEHGTFSVPEVAVSGTFANYTCNAGYRFDNDSTVVCGDNSKWSTPTPVCVPTACPSVPSIDYGYASTNNTAVGTLVEYTCIEGYSFQNVTTARCLEGGTWSSPIPVCLPPDCYPIATIDNGHPVGTQLSTVFGSAVKYVCNENYEFTDTDTTKCLITGYWSVLPECLRKGCGPPFPDVPNAIIVESSNGTEVAVAQYKCVDGYELVGNDTVECLATNAWSAIPYCEMVCGEVPEIAFGGPIDSPSNMSANGTEVTYKCNPGYDLVGPNPVICLYENWTQTPICETRCPDLDIVFLLDGSGSVGEFGFKDTLNFVNSMLDQYPELTTRVGIATFSNGVNLAFNLDKYINDMKDLKAAVSKTSYPTGNTRTDLALEYARTDMFQEKNGMRPEALKAVVVVTDGLAQDRNETQHQADLLKSQNVTVYSVGVGLEIDQVQLRGIASKPSYVFNVDNYGAITTVAGPLTEATCKKPDEEAED